MSTGDWTLGLIEYPDCVCPNCRFEQLVRRTDSKTLMEAIGSTNWREYFSGEEPQSQTSSNDPLAARA